MTKRLTIIYLLSIFFSLFVFSCSKDKDEEEKVYFTVTFDADGGMPIPLAQRVAKGETIVAPSIVPQKTGFVFVCWSEDGTSSYDFHTPVTRDFTLRAKWQSEAVAEYWNVTWELNGGSWPTGDNHVDRVLKGGTLTEPLAPVKTGNTFDGWYQDAGLSKKISFPYDVSTQTSDITLYAKWMKEDIPGDFVVFSSIEDLYSWLQKQPFDKEYKVGLKGINLDSGDNWRELRRTIKAASIKNQTIFLNLKSCTGRMIPNGEWEDSKLYATFNELRNLEKVILPETLEIIGEYAFYKCGISEIEFPDQLQVIGRKAFLGCHFSAIEFPAALQKIGEAAFVSCGVLASIKLPQGLKEIGEGAFKSSGLETVSIPNPATKIGSGAFSYCSKLTRVMLPEGITSLGYWFVENEALQSINIPSTVKVIEKLALSGCKTLPTIAIPNGVIKIEEGAFLGCAALPSIKLPESLKEIGGKGVFSDCTFSTIEFPKGVQTIGNGVLGKSAIIQIRMLGEIPPILEGELYTNSPFVFQIRVPASAVDTYKKAKGWKQYADKISAE
ncbi:hypothetical protein HQ45_05710 [Porphyromonas crevioricanis]|uniref:leucine-rich repeat protein n=1 Tax=Porphyromonas crevioricanis TaxID=393921 RepID=UPI00052B5255|nr:leucine-rich repeat protein [Porphyromonas crevioricanis]KGN90279.1 hypothetical protein HQ45_05710 [Porphyromonas crevioricanis]